MTEYYLLDNILEIIEKNYQNVEHFKSAYLYNRHNVYSLVISKMKVIPIDIKAIIDRAFQEVITQEPPDDYNNVG